MARLLLDLHLSQLPPIYKSLSALATLVASVDKRYCISPRSIIYLDGVIEPHESQEIS
jgi:hypothetical protein